MTQKYFPLSVSCIVNLSFSSYHRLLVVSRSLGTFSYVLAGVKPTRHVLGQSCDFSTFRAVGYTELSPRIASLHQQSLTSLAVSSVENVPAVACFLFTVFDSLVRLLLFARQ